MEKVNHQITEAICEFNLPPDFKWDLTIPGRMHDKVKDVFPIIDQGQIAEIETKTELREIQQKIRVRHFAEFLNNNRNISLRVGPLVLAILCSKAYPRWPSFKSNIELAFNSFTKLIKVDNFQKISLKYVNTIELPIRSIKLEEYFDIRPFIGKDLPQEMRRFLVKCALPLNNERDLCDIQLNDMPPTRQGIITFRLIIEYILVNTNIVVVPETIEWIEQAHNDMNKIFKACISDKLKQSIDFIS